VLFDYSFPLDTQAMEEFVVPASMVVDHGTGTIKVGMSTDDRPRVVFPSFVGRMHKRLWKGDPSLFPVSPFVGEEAIKIEDLLRTCHPFERGYAVNWDAIEKVG